MDVRRYGPAQSPCVVVLHGGPGAPGTMAPVARELSDRFFVLEPLQTARSIEEHIRDLDTVMNEPAPLVGSSWGAMLALCYAARHPTKVTQLILIGCGTFDAAARAEFRRLLDERMSDELRARVEAADLATSADLMTPLYTVDALTTDLEVTEIDEAGHHESWSDMIRLQEDGTYPAAFEAIESPVVMLHGDYDPHPGKMIRDGLARHIEDVTYEEFERCGHYPWIERDARDAFFVELRRYLD